MKIRILPVVVLLVTLSGCVGPMVEDIRLTSSAAEELRRDIPTLTTGELDNRSYDVLSSVSATSCFNNFVLDSPASKDKAIDQLRLKARRFGADAIMNPYCAKKGTSLATNCWYSFYCEAVAIRINKTPKKRASDDKKPTIASGSAFFISGDGFVT